jgi:signal transduction histidine kinase
MKNKNSANMVFNSLIWKIGGMFLIILLLLSAAYLYISVYTAEMYFKETLQKLDAEIAPHITAENKCFVDGKANDEALHHVFHSIMVINPSLEVYLLDTEGKILTYFAPYKKIKLEYVSLDPIKSFIADSGSNFILGDDPRNFENSKPFSAAEVYEGDVLMGYIYVVLGGEEYDNAAQLVFGSYILTLGLRSMIITFIAAAIITIIILGLITKNLRNIVSVIRKFKNGDLSARIKMKGGGELQEFAGSFNEMADTIVSNMEELKTMDNLRRELVANVSHDLRTPLATIQGYIETILLKNQTLSEEDRQKYMETILGSSERLKKLVDELFELSKLEARATLPKPEPFQLSELAQDIEQKNIILAEANNISLHLDCPRDLPMAYADIAMIEKVIQNLLDNAIKYTPENGSVTLKLEPDKENIIVRIIDSGTGIKKEEIPHIFDRYHQVKKIDKDGSGLGLGLAIVKKIMEVHEMEISVDSRVNSGSAFSFSVPIYKKSNPIKKQLHSS